MPEPNSNPVSEMASTDANEVQYQQTLTQIGALQNAILNSAYFSYMATDARGLIQVFNVGVERMLGYAAADVINKLSPADLSDPQEVIERARALTSEQGTPIALGFEALVFKANRNIVDIYELTYIRQDGSRLPAVVSVTALRDVQNAIIGYLLIVTDNTEHKQVEAKIAKANLLLTCIKKSQTAFILDQDPMAMFKNVLDQLMQASESEYGFIAETLYDQQGLPYIKVFAISDLAWRKASQKMDEIASTTGLEFHNLKTLFGAVLTSGVPVISNDPANDPRRGGMPEGHPPLHRLLGIPFFKQGKPIGMYMVANRPAGYDESMVQYLQPFTESLANLVEAAREEKQRKLAEKKLHESEQRFRSLVETASTILLQLDAQGVIAYANPYLAQLTGYRSDEVIGKDWFATFLPERDRERMRTLAHVVMGGQKVPANINPILTHDGQELQIEWYNCERRDAQGQVNGILATGQNITERLKIEQALQATLAEKDVLLREIHHRVKNNLQMISALLELQAGYVTEPQTLNYFQDTQQRIKSMALIYEQLYHQTNLDQIDFAAYLNSLTKSLDAQFANRSRQVKLRIDAQPCTLPVDIAIPCGLIVNELVSNVFKHAFPSGRSGEAVIKLECNGLGNVLLEVADDGVGMPPGLDPQSSKTFGLRLLALMVEKQLHGKLTIESRQGTRVTCQLGVPK